MAVTTPTNLTYGTITGRFLLTTLDSTSDPDAYPDYLPAAGTVTFTPNVTSYKNLAVPAIFATATVTGTIDAFGDLRDAQGRLGVVLVATNNPDLSPRDWTYTVTITLTGLAPITFPILVTGGSTLDLTTVSPATISAGTAVVVSSADRVAAQQAAAASAVSAAQAAQSAIDAATAGGGGGLTSEQVQDVMGAITAGSGYVTVTYNDAANTLIISTSSTLDTVLNSKAPINSPVFTGTPIVPGYFTTTAAASKADLVGGLIPTAQLPPLAINDVFVVASQSAMLALTAQRGDMAIRTDLGSTFVLATDSPTTLADWKTIAAPGGVTAVAGKTGNVALVVADVTGLQTALDAKMAISLLTNFTIYADTSTTFPSRSSSIPVGYTGRVTYDSTLYLNHPDPTDRLVGDIHKDRIS